MAQHDYDIANQSGANFRTDLNNALDAIVSNNSGSSEPSTKFAYEWWIDTSNNLLKLRNSANNAWITLPLSITADNATSGALTVNGNLTTTGTVDINGQELILDADADTSITADTDDQIDFKIGNVDVATLTNSNLVLKGTTPTLTIGDAGEEDTKIVFDGNAQDFYIGLDDSADDLIIGKGSAVGTTPAIIVDENLQVGIGATPHTTMVVNGGTFADIALQSSNSGTGASQGSLISIDTANRLYFFNHEDAPVIFGTNNAERMRIDSSGHVGIGITSSILADLHVKSPDDSTAGYISGGTYALGIDRDQASGTNYAWYIGTSSSNTINFYDSGGTSRAFVGLGGINSTSDISQKENIIDITYGLDVVKSLQPRNFKWKDTTEMFGEKRNLTGKDSLGFIAQEMSSKIPEIVEGTDGQGDMSINYSALTAVLTKAIQELSAKVEELESKIDG